MKLSEKQRAEIRARIVASVRAQLVHALEEGDVWALIDEVIDRDGDTGDHLVVIMLAVPKVP